MINKKYNLDRMRKYLSPKTSNLPDEELIKHLDAISAEIPQVAIPKMATGTVIPVGVRLLELKREMEEARHREILDAIKQNKGPNEAPEKQTIENTRIPVSTYDSLCILWVNRPYIPKQNKDEFLSQYASELNKKTFDRILEDAYKRGIIDKVKGRYKPKTVS